MWDAVVALETLHRNEGASLPTFAIDNRDDGLFVCVVTLSLVEQLDGLANTVTSAPRPSHAAAKEHAAQRALHLIASHPLSHRLVHFAPVRLALEANCDSSDDDNDDDNATTTSSFAKLTLEPRSRPSQPQVPRKDVVNRNDQTNSNTSESSTKMFHERFARYQITQRERREGATFLCAMVVEDIEGPWSAPCSSKRAAKAAACSAFLATIDFNTLPNVTNTNKATKMEFLETSMDPSDYTPLLRLARNVAWIDGGQNAKLLLPAVINIVRMLEMNLIPVLIPAEYVVESVPHFIPTCIIPIYVAVQPLPSDNSIKSDICIDNMLKTFREKIDEIFLFEVRENQYFIEHCVDSTSTFLITEIPSDVCLEIIPVLDIPEITNGSPSIVSTLRPNTVTEMLPLYWPSYQDIISSIHEFPKVAEVIRNTFHHFIRAYTIFDQRLMMLLVSLRIMVAICSPRATLRQLRTLDRFLEVFIWQYSEQNPELKMEDLDAHFKIILDKLLTIDENSCISLKQIKLENPILKSIGMEYTTAELSDLRFFSGAPFYDEYLAAISPNGYRLSQVSKHLRKNYFIKAPQTLIRVTQLDISEEGGTGLNSICDYVNPLLRDLIKNSESLELNDIQPIFVRILLSQCLLLEQEDGIDMSKRSRLLSEVMNRITIKNDVGDSVVFTHEQSLIKGLGKVNEEENEASDGNYNQEVTYFDSKYSTVRFAIPSRETIMQVSVIPVRQ